MTDFDIPSFLEEYQRYPCLWFKKDVNYKLRHKRDAAEEALLAFTKLKTIKELRQKMRSIRCTYNQEKAKVRSSMVTGSGKHEVYVPKLSWFTFADSFLNKNNDGERESDSNLAISFSDSTNIQVEELETPNLVLNKGIEDTGAVESAEGIKANITETTTTKKRTKKKSGPTTNKVSRYDESLNKAVDTLKFVCEQKSITNEFLIFGQHVAAQLEKLPLEKSVFLQEKIQSMLTKARFEEIAASSTGRHTKIINETNYDYSQIEEHEPETSEDDVSESENISVYYNNFT